MRSVDQEKTRQQARRTFTDEFKAGAVRLVLDEGKSVAQVARDLGLWESVLALVAAWSFERQG
jgi:transposase